MTSQGCCADIGWIDFYLMDRNCHRNTRFDFLYFQIYWGGGMAGGCHGSWYRGTSLHTFRVVAAELETIKKIFDIELSCEQLYTLVGTTGGLSLIASSVPGLSTIFKLAERGVGHAVRSTYMMTKIATSLSNITKKLWRVSLKSRVFLKTVFSATAPYPMLLGCFCIPQLIIGMHSLLGMKLKIN